jgi:hypothetical protein
VSAAGVRELSLPLSASSLIASAARATHVVTTSARDPAGPDAVLLSLLSSPATAAAIAVRIGGQVGFVLVVGDVSGRPDGNESRALAELSCALGAAWERISARE